VVPVWICTTNVMKKNSIAKCSHWLLACVLPHREDGGADEDRTLAARVGKCILDAQARCFPLLVILLLLCAFFMP
jgi:hypothetical protein